MVNCGICDMKLSARTIFRDMEKRPFCEACFMSIDKKELSTHVNVGISDETFGKMCIYAYAFYHKYNSQKR